MRFDAAILGATGFGGGELLRWLSNHPACGSVQALSRRSGVRIAEVHPHLAGLWNQDFATEIDWTQLEASEAPVIFAAMPHGEFASTFEALWENVQTHNLQDRIRIIDLSADFRVTDHGVYHAAYGKDHACPHHLKGWIYGLPEWNREEVRQAHFIANPGCFATAIQLGVLPLRGLEDPRPLFISAATGSSGSGAAPSEGTHHPTRAHDFRAYKALAHQHQLEIACHVGAGLDIEFVPQSAPMVRGIFATIQFAAIPGVETAFEAAYADEPLIRLVKGTPRVAAVAGSAFAEIAVARSQTRIALMVATDNLGKGMATQAIQNLNLSLGLKETTGLLMAGSYP